VAEATKKKSALFSKIETREEALKVVRDCSGGFFVIAAIQGLIGAFLIPSMIIDAVLLGTFAFILRMWQWRFAAIVLLLMALLILVTTVTNRLGITAQGGGNIFVAALLVLIGVRSVQATFILVKKRPTAAPTMAPPMSQAVRR
jgi:hypothetical protein